MRRLELILLCVVVLLAAWLRFRHIDQAEFLWDQSEISKWALDAGRRGEFRFIGPMSSTGLTTFPVAIWLMAVPFALSPSPVFGTGFVALINLLAVIGCYFLARHWFGRRAALVAALLYTVAPWAVIYSRKIWHTVLLPPLVVLHVATAWLAFVKGRRWALLAHGLVLAMLVQTHFAALPCVLLTALWGLIFFKRLDWRFVLIGALIAMLTFVPYFVVDATRGWRSTPRFLKLAQLPATVDADAVHATWAITTGWDLHILTSLDLYPDFVAGTLNVRWLFAVVGVLAAVGVAAALWRAARRARTALDDETAAALMTATWLLMPTFFLTRHNTMVASHYFTATFPAQFILVGWVVAQTRCLKGRLARVGQVLLIALVVVLAVAQVYETVSVLQFVMTRDTTLGGYGTPIAYEIEAVETANHLRQELGGDEVVVLALGDEPRVYEMPNAADVLMVDTPHRSVDIRSALVFPANPAVYWAAYEMSPGEDLLATFTPEIADARVPLREGVRSFRFYHWPGGEPGISCKRSLPDGPRTWANGAQLIGYCLEGDLRPGEKIRWTLIWRPSRTPTEDVYYHWFNHLVDRSDELRAQQDGPSLLPAYWRAGDTILNWFELQIPPDAPPDSYTMRVGMYTYPDVASVPLVDADGSPMGDWVEIELLSVSR
ncbi:MAG: glycosyltransferase family 39 protein [Anaerolineae bacterium]|nr:glycosyltransferase family 39 protein [Anaerolineae bacterium]